jgi:hypothetical protein
MLQAAAWIVFEAGLIIAITFDDMVQQRTLSERSRTLLYHDFDAY